MNARLLFCNHYFKVITLVYIYQTWTAYINYNYFVSGFFKLRIFTDSKFLIECWENYIDKWLANGWMTSKNKEAANRRELEALLNARSYMDVVDFVNKPLFYTSSKYLIYNSTPQILMSGEWSNTINLECE